jgi:hypothetical protein
MTENNKYYEAIEQIKTPVQLKDKVRKKIERQIIRKRVVRFGYGAGVLAASIILVIGVFFQQRVDENLIVTDLAVGEHIQEVALQEGHLSFFIVRDEDRAGIRLAAPFPVQQVWTLEEAQVLPVRPPEGLSEPYGEVIAYFSQLSGEPEAIIGYGVYQMEKGGRLTVRFTDNLTLLPLPISIGGSYIRDVVVGVGFVESENIYYGVFEIDNYRFLIEGEGLYQDEFIRLLYYFVSYGVGG